MERPYFNRVMKEEGEYKDGGPATEMLCQQQCCHEVPTSLADSHPIFSKVAGGPCLVKLLLLFLATFSFLLLTRPWLPVLLHPFNQAKLFLCQQNQITSRVFFTTLYQEIE